MAAKANANTRQPMAIRAAGNPSKLDRTPPALTGVSMIPLDPGRPPGASK